ncbi:serine hydrolase domain-containing protein [Limimaricola cinnabarinus]|uniref:Beta-lactamase-related domain-containing protein n=1 Tax=Limimaricola cinnabarinus TaxID=1125964 RepID=A0A2G1MEH4_9RHOB|nr:serine hydrolase [Limimaricola cinnabarinus]PHP27097.1 hypothetical protein CJ301_13280 [Limimaricola cinnabarinus]
MQRLSQMHSLQVMRGDDVVFAEAPRGPGLDAFANIKSCSKSIVALLLGVAVDREEISGVTAKLEQVAPGIVPRDATSGVAGITMEDLVTLRAGLERTSGGNYGEWISAGNWLADAMTRPMVAEPGTRMLYSTGSTHILGAALAEATGQSLLAQARERLGGPFAMEIPRWTRDLEGYYLSGNEMALRPSDMLKLAVMMRDGGRFGGAQVIPRDWITASTEPRTRSPWSGLSYGYGGGFTFEVQLLYGNRWLHGEQLMGTCYAHLDLEERQKLARWREAKLPMKVRTAVRKSATVAAG